MHWALESAKQIIHTVTVCAQRWLPRSRMKNKGVIFAARSSLVILDTEIYISQSHEQVDISHLNNCTHL